LHILPKLAKALGVSRPAIAKLESGKAKNIELRTLVRAVSALGGTVRIRLAKGGARKRGKVDLLTHRTRSAD
jgi:transcriptional regulator with XRE-family HTH domain